MEHAWNIGTQPKVKKLCKVIGLYVKFMYNVYYVGRENNYSHSKASPIFNLIHVSVNDYLRR